MTKNDLFETEKVFDLDSESLSVFPNLNPSPRMDFDDDGKEEKIPSNIVLSTVNMEEVAPEADFDYSVSLELVPTMVGDENKEDIMESMGGDEDMWSDEMSRTEMIEQYGISVPLWGKTGDDLEEMIKEAKEKAPAISGLIGFYLDKPVNRVGSTGWDILRDALGGKSWVDAGIERSKKKQKKKLNEEMI